MSIYVYRGRMRECKAGANTTTGPILLYLKLYKAGKECVIRWFEKSVKQF